MKTRTFYFGLLFFGILLSSCDQKEKQAVIVEEEPEVEIKDQTNSFIQEYPNAKKMKEIEQRINPANRVESLYWEKQTKHGSQFTQVAAYLNDDGMPMKITEYYIDGNFQPQGQRHYYLEDNKLIAFLEQSDYWIDSNMTNYSEKRTIYNDTKPVVTQSRHASTFDEIEDEKWKNIRQEHNSLEKVNKILSGVEEFEPHFISVIQSDQLFLLLGEPKTQNEERYTTAVRVDEMTPFIEDLLKNLDKYKFKPVTISFEVVGGNNSPEYRVLTDIAWKE